MIPVRVTFRQRRTGKTLARMEAPVSWIQTYTGKKFDAANPTAEMIDIVDVARGLSTKFRFSGHLVERLTVAQHSVVASWIVPSWHAFRALLHDGAEAYLSDVPSPIKAMPEMAGFRAIEARTQSAIWEAFDLPIVDPDAYLSVKLADQMLVRAEAERWFADVPEWVTKYPRLAQEYSTECEIPLDILPLDRVWEPGEACARFLERFWQLDALRRSV